MEPCPRSRCWRLTRALRCHAPEKWPCWLWWRGRATTWCRRTARGSTGGRHQVGLAVKHRQQSVRLIDYSGESLPTALVAVLQDGKGRPLRGDARSLWGSCLGTCMRTSWCHCLRMQAPSTSSDWWWSSVGTTVATPLPCTPTGTPTSQAAEIN